MNDEKNQVRRWFTGTTTEFEAVWEHLCENGFVDTATTVDDIIYDADKVLQLLRRAAPEDHPEPLRRVERSFEKEIEVELDDYTREREEVFSEVAAAIATTHPDVQRFRIQQLDGQLLTREEAGEVLFGNGEPNRRLDMDKLHLLGGQLAKHYHWRGYEATWFVLTGDTPPVQLLGATLSQTLGKDHYPNTARITLTVDPCIDAKTVEKLYRSAQRQLLGGDNRKLAQRTLKAARFAAQQIKEHGKESWQKRTDRWNLTFPDWRYKSRGGLRQAFEKFWHPDHGSFQFKSYDPTPAQQSRDDHHRRRHEAISKALRKRGGTPAQ